jgi:hypothetical protein
MKAIDYFFFTIKRLNRYNPYLIIDIFNTIDKFVNLLKFDINQNLLMYYNITNKIKKLKDTDKKDIGYLSSNTKTFIYSVFK